MPFVLYRIISAVRRFLKFIWYGTPQPRRSKPRWNRRHLKKLWRPELQAFDRAINRGGKDRTMLLGLRRVAVVRRNHSYLPDYIEE